MQSNQLSKRDVEKVRVQAREKLVAYCKLNDVIGTQIFSILEKESKVLYYPLEDQKVWGFSEIIKGKSFVCINTSIPYEKQVFAAAHELYHIWYGSSGEIMLSEDDQEPDTDKEVELCANRFAAEFLVNEELLLQEMRTYGIEKADIEMKDIVRLSNIFVVPYRTMVKRLYEIGVFKEKAFTYYMMYSDEQADIWKSRLGLSVPVRKEKIGLSDLVNKAMELYEKKLITYEKLEYLLKFAELTPSKMGIEKSSGYQAPTDDELDAIMEE